ncbi:hypothetical protein [Leptospira perolatii]|uniref:Lipoprotein n=1 Tax=Leptospira perolatii TaxID=2023191 RepID=A0ABX4P7F5_9LEPT|nr:hypothetical protein [Leptospira perolatii]PJZ69017.1 hypothetical protein CH360_13230 [Leptospira perolatii]
MKQRNLRLLFFAILIMFGACEDQKENKTLKDVYNHFVENIIQNPAPSGTPGSDPGTGTGSSNFNACAKVLKISADDYFVQVSLIPYASCKKELLLGRTPEEYRAVRLAEFKKSMPIVSAFPTECEATIKHLQERIDDPSKIETITQQQIDMTRYYPIDNLLKETKGYLLNYSDYNYTPISEETFAGSQVGTFSENERYSELMTAGQLQYSERLNETTCSTAVGNQRLLEFPQETYFSGRHIDSPRTFLFSFCYYGNYFDVPERKNQKCATLSEEY